MSPAARTVHLFGLDLASEGLAVTLVRDLPAASTAAARRRVPSAP